MASGLVRQLVFSQWRYWPAWHHSHLPHDDVVLDEDEIAFLEALALGELAAGLGDIADVLVAHDGGLVVRRMLVELDVGAADAGDLHLHQGARPPGCPASGIRGSRSCSVRSGRPPALSLPLSISFRRCALGRGGIPQPVTPGLDPGVHSLRRRWMAGSSPAMTAERDARLCQKEPRAYRGPRPGAGVGARAVFARRGGDPGGRGGLRGAGLPADRDRDRVLVGRNGGTISRCSSRWPR